MNKDVQRYFDNLPTTRRERVEVLHALIIQLFPKATVDMGYKMPTYRVGEGWVAVASQKHYVSLYTCGYEHIESFKEKHPSIKTGKGCVNFRDKDELPLDDVKAVIRHAIKHPK